MANSSIVSTEEENFVRIFLLTNEISPKAIRKVFNREFNPNQLKKQLNVLYSKIMKLRNQHIINQSQYDMLYPLGGGPNSETFDISLMVTFLRHFTKISRPKKGFDQLPDKADTTEGDDVARIKFYRNQIAHKSETKMTTTQFSEVWSTVAAAAVRIGGSDIAQECNSLRFAVFASAHHEILLQLKLFRSQLTEIKIESIPQNIRRLHLTEIANWRKEDENYVEIEASRYVYECIQSNPCMLIVGVSGAGKTATAHHVALQMHNHLDYVIVPIKSPFELEKYFSISKKQIFLVDDFCGRYTVIQNDINEWLKYMESTKSILKEFSVKLILTCRLQVFRESQFKHLTFLTQSLCNMSAEFVLSEEERKSIANMYLPSEADKIPAMGCYDAFPLMCNLYSKNQQLLLKEFFTNPYEIYESEFQMLFDQSDKTKFCALVLIVLTNNHIKETWITECDNPFFNAMLENACDECCITPASSKRLIIEHLNSFLLTYLQKVGDIYTTKHDTIFDFLAGFVGKKFSDCVLKYGNYSLINERCMLESINEECNEFSIIINENKEKYYFDRLIYELKNGHLLSIFSSTQMNSDDYRRKLMTNLETKLATSFASLLDQIDKETGYSPLLFCCFAGYLDMVNFLVKSRVDINKHCIKNYDISPLYIASQQGNFKIVQILLKYGAEKNSYIENGSTPVYIASQQGHIDIVRLLLCHEADPNLSRENGCTPLHSACQEGHFDIVCLLIHNKADVNLCNVMNESALFLSCQEGHEEIVTFLLENTALVNSSTKDNLTPLFIACNQGHLSIVELLLTSKADVNACSVGLSPLMISCQNEMYDIVKVLLMNKANVNFETTTQSTALFDACDLNSKKIVRLLLAYDAQVNHIRDDESTPLFIACRNGQSGIVRILLMKNADPTLCRNDTSPLFVACNNGFVKVVDILVHHESNCRMINKCTDDKTSPLFIACQEGFESIVALLLKNGADCNICRFNGISPLYAASELGYEKIVDMLLQAISSTSKSVDEFVFEETTPLFIASQNGHSKIVSKLIECSADVNYCRDQKNQETSPLFIACQEGHIRIVEDLIYAKANTNAGCNDISCLFIACSEGHNDIINLLLDAGANVNSLTNDGVSALYAACENGNATIITRLLEKNIDINQSIADGSTPLFKACEEGYSEIVIMLLQKDAELQKIQQCRPTTAETSLSDIQELPEGESIHITETKSRIQRAVDMRRNDGASPLFISCAEGNIDIVQELLKHGANAEQCTKDGISPLDMAFESNSLDIVEMLLDGYVSVNKQSDKGKTPLYIACKFGYVKIVRLLKNRKTKVNKHKKNKTTPLYIASKKGHISVVKELIKWDSSGKNAIDIDLQRDDGNTPLFIACKKGFTDIVQVLLDANATVNIQNIIGESPLFISTLKQKVECSNLLLSRPDVEVNSYRHDDQTFALYQTCRFGNSKITAVLLQHNANINQCNSEHETSLFISCLYGHEQIVEILLQNETIDVEKCKVTGASPLYAACQGGYELLVRMLLRRGANVNKKTLKGSTPLHIACETNRLKIVHILLNNNAKVDVYTNDQISPLYLASQEGYLKIVKLLMKRSMKSINYCSVDSTTPLYAACIEGHVDVVSHLLRNGADENITPFDKKSCLFVACEKGKSDVATFLVQETNLVHQYSSYETCPLYIACRNGYLDIVERLVYLKDYGNDIQINSILASCENGYRDIAEVLIKIFNLYEHNYTETNPLHLSCENGHDNIVHLLLQNGIDVNSYNYQNETPLMIAARNGFEDMVSTLLDFNADFNKTDYDGNTAIKLAEANNFPDVVEVLRRKMFRH